MNEVSDDVKKVLEQIKLLTINAEQLNNQINKSGSTASAKNQLSQASKAPTIEQSELRDPESGPDNVRGKHKNVIRKTYRTIDVACKKVQTIEKNNSAESQKIQTELAILNLLKICTHIITFYGVSKIEVDDMMIFEWAEFGDLKEFYTKNTISWSKKLQFVSDIFSGLNFIYNSGILHHDVRCENVLVSKNNKSIIYII